MNKLSTHIHRNSSLGMALFLVMWLWFTLTPVPPIHACLPVGRFDFTVAERTIDAEIVIEGTVLKNSNADTYAGAGNDFGSIEAASSTSALSSYGAKILVHQYLKGEGPTIVEVVGFGWGSDCLSSAFPGDHLIFFANGNPVEVLTANYMGVHSATEIATNANIVEAVQASGQQPIKRNLSIKQRFIIFWYKIRGQVVCLTPIVFVILLWFARKKYTQDKQDGSEMNLQM